MIGALLSRVRQALSLVVLLLLWGLVILPVAVISRWVRGDVLGQPDPAARTYWVPPPADDDAGLVTFFTRNGKLWLLPVIAVLLGLGVLLIASESSLVLAFLYPLF